jgi:NADH-quinone oxidoreductase subunit G
MAWRQLAEAVPFYEGLTLEDLGGRGIRWPARAQASAMPAGTPSPDAPRTSRPSATPDASAGVLLLGRYRPIWAAPEVEISPALHFAIAEQLIELSPDDASSLGISEGDALEVVQRNGAPPGDDTVRLLAKATIRTGVQRGTAFLADGLRAESANVLTEALIEVHRR